MPFVTTLFACKQGDVRQLADIPVETRQKREPLDNRATPVTMIANNKNVTTISVDTPNRKRSWQPYEPRVFEHVLGSS